MALRDPRTFPIAWPSFELAAETGGMELAVAETTLAICPRPQKVTAILYHAVKCIEGHAATQEFVRDLSVGTREWLLQQVAGECRPAQDWHEAQCSACTTRFDITLDLARLPRSDVPADFPVVRIELSGMKLVFEVPNGVIEERLARNPSWPDVEFLQACALDQETADAVSHLAAADLDRVGAAIDDATPETADTVSCDCPECGNRTKARIDPLCYAFPLANGVLKDVHLLSSTYRWSEAEVLVMPTRRRRTYVDMIAASRGAA